MIQKLFKQIIPYLLFLLAGIFFLRLSDESRTPITIDACDMNRSAGYEDDTSIGLTPDSQYQGTMLTSASYLLDPGIYTLGIAYRTTGEDNELVIYDNGVEAGIYSLDPSTTYKEYTFELEQSCLDFQFKINYDGDSELLVQSATLIPAESFYKDTAFLTILFVLFTIAFAVWRIYITKGTGILPATADTSKYYTVFTLLGIGLFASLPYLNTGLNWAIDLCYHLIRIEGIKDGLLAGQFPVVIFPEALHGNGYLNCMYPNLFLYIPAYLRMQGVSMADSFKFLIFIFNFATAFLTYHCAKTIGCSRKAAILASLLYTCSPYRFTNIYARGAVGEFLAMTFFPLIFTGLYHIFIGNKEKWGYLVLGMTGLLQSHILSVILGGVFCGIFTILYLKELFTKKRILSMIKAVVISLLLNLGFLIPFLDFYKNGNLWMDALNLGTYQEYTLNLSALFGLQTTGDYYMLTLGIPLTICGIISLAYILIENRGKVQENYLQYMFILGAFLTFMLINFFPGWKMMTLPMLDLILNKVQFAWRLLGPVSLLFAITGSVFLFRSRMLKRYNRILFVVLAGICMLSATRFRSEDFAYSSERNYTMGHESKIIGIPKGKNTVVYPFEWRPRHTADSGISTELTFSDESLISLHDTEREGTTTTVEYTCLANDQYIEIPVIYYQGYAAYDENGDKVDIASGYNSRIRLPLQGDNTLHTITVDYRIPATYTLAAWISILTAMLLLVYRSLPLLKKISLITRKGENNVR